MSSETSAAIAPSEITAPVQPPASEVTQGSDAAAQAPAEPAAPNTTPTEADADALPPAETVEPPRSPEDIQAARQRAEDAAATVGKAIILSEVAGTENLSAQGVLNRLLTVQKETEGAALGSVVSYQSGGDVLPPEVASNGTAITARQVKIEGKVIDVKILRIAGTVNRDGKAYAQCVYEYQQGKARKGNTGGKPAAEVPMESLVEIPLQSIIDGQIVAERQTLTAGFTGEEKTIAEYAINQLAGNTQATPESEEFFSDANLDSATETVIRLAKANGFITTDDIDSYLTALALKIKPGQTPTAEQQAEIDRVAEIRKHLPDTIIVTPKILQEVITNNPDAKITVDEANASLASLEKEATQLLEQLQDEHLPFTDSQRLQKHYKDLMQQREQLQVLRDVAALSENGNIQDGIKKYFELLANGQIPKDIAKKFREGLRTADMERVFEALSAPVKNPNESAEAFKKRQEKYLATQRLRKKGKRIGGLAGIIVLLAMTTVSNEFKSDVNEELSGPKR